MDPFESAMILVLPGVGDLDCRGMRQLRRGVGERSTEQLMQEVRNGWTLDGACKTGCFARSRQGRLHGGPASVYSFRTSCRSAWRENIASCKR
jgi:hypothetical protein